MAGNNAAHGARVEASVAQWAIDYGPRVLAVLDDLLKAPDWAQAPEKPTRGRGQAMAEALTSMADRGTFSAITDPVSWQQIAARDVTNRRALMLLDSDILIYAAKPRYAALRQVIAEQAPVVSVISYIEILGYHG